MGYVWEGGALVPVTRSGESADGAESTRVPLARRTLFTFYSHAANLTGGRTIAITRLRLRLRLLRLLQLSTIPSTLSTLSSTVLASSTILLSPSTSLYVSLLLCLRLPLSFSINSNSLFNSFFVVLQLPLRRVCG